MLHSRDAGDHDHRRLSGTAQNIAKQIGLSSASEVITGPELDSMDDAKLQRLIKSVNIFARVVPEQKLRIVNALRQQEK